MIKDMKCILIGHMRLNTGLEVRIPDHEFRREGEF